MRIVFVTPLSDGRSRQSGVASYSRALVKALPLGRGDQLTVLANVSVGEHTRTQVAPRKQLLRCWQPGRGFSAPILSAIDEIEPDVVHLQHEIFLYGGIPTALEFVGLLRALKRRGIPTVVTVHGVVRQADITEAFVRANFKRYPAWFTRLGFRLIFWSLVAAATHLIVHAETLGTVLEAEYGAHSTQWSAIPHGLTLTRRRTAKGVRSTLGWYTTDHVALFLGYYTGYKGLEQLIEAFPAWRVRDPRARLIVAAGAHPKLAQNSWYRSSYQALQRTVASFGSDARWVGFVPDEVIPDYLSLADVLVLPYRFGMAASGPLTHAVSFGTPVLVSEALAYLVPDPALRFSPQPGSLSRVLTAFFANQQARTAAQRWLATTRRSSTWSTVGRATMTRYRSLMPAATAERS